MAPHFRLPGALGEKKKKKKNKQVEGNFTWFETSVNGGAVVLNILQNAANMAPLPFLKGAAATTLALIQTAQNMNDNAEDFRRLCEDAATLTVVIYQSREGSEDPDGWPGQGLKEPVDSFLRTLNKVAEFARAQGERARIIRAMNSIADGHKIREFRERLGQAMSQFEVSAHLQSYEVLRMVKNMMEDHRNRLDEQAAIAQQIKEDLSSHNPLPAIPSETESDVDEQTLQDEQLAQNLEAEEKRQAEAEARRKEQEAVNQKLQEIVRLLETASEQGQSSKADGSSSGDERILGMIMKDSADKRANRETRKKDLDTILSGKMHGLNLAAGSPHDRYYSGRGGRGPLRLTNKNSGNVNSSTVYGSHNDNSTVTRIAK